MVTMRLPCLEIDCCLASMMPAMAAAFWPAEIRIWLLKLIRSQLPQSIKSLATRERKLSTALRLAERNVEELTWRTFVDDILTEGDDIESRMLSTYAVEKWLIGGSVGYRGEYNPYWLIMEGWYDLQLIPGYPPEFFSAAKSFVDSKRQRLEGCCRIFESCLIESPKDVFEQLRKNPLLAIRSGGRESAVRSAVNKFVNDLNNEVLMCEEEFNNVMAQLAWLQLEVDSDGGN